MPPSTASTPPSETGSTGRDTRRRRRWIAAVAVVGLAVVGMALLAWPFLAAPDEAQSARDDLESASAALSAGRTQQAEAAVEDARVHTDAVQDAVGGVGGALWSWVPLAGGPVRDARHLAAALDDITSVAEIGVEVMGSAQGRDATLFTDGGVDLAILEEVIGSVRDAQDHLDAAESRLDDIGDDRLLTGTTLSEIRDTALDRVAPLASGARDLTPLLDALPGVLGGEGKRTYLVAMLNPSEQRFSGGAPLALSPVVVRDGRVDIGTTQTTTNRELYRVVRWPKVEGNPFHRGPLRLSAANYAPSWPVSGEELLRGWARLRGEETDGLIAVDVVAMASLLAVPGPIRVPVYGELSADDFTEKLVGDYDAYPDNAARHELNRAIVPVFAERLFGPGGGVDKLTTLYEAAQGRHFALWLRDPPAQAAFADMGFDGDLSDTEHDYLAVFNQNANASKADYWQRRTVRSRVSLAADGSARVRMTISVRNDSPPYRQPFDDPRGGTSATRWNGMALGVFLPVGAKVTSASQAGDPVGLHTGDYFGRPFKRLRLTIPPRKTREAVLDYTVPAAATVGADGALTYRLDLTPQGMVIPQSVKVAVTWPDGYSIRDLPEGWTTPGTGRATYRNEALTTQPSFAVTATP